MRYMFDAVDPLQIPTTAELVAGYVDGARSKWPDDAWARFPDAQLVRITTDPNSSALAEVIDCEQGDYVVGDIPAKLGMLREHGIDPTVYCAESSVQPLITACTNAGVAVPHVWLARPNGDPTIPVGFVAVQFVWGPVGGGPTVDVSAVLDYWPGVDTLSAPLTTADATAMYQQLSGVQVAGMSIDALALQRNPRRRRALVTLV